jgi:hypothetical protein
MQCPQCGTSIPKNAKFCSHCGARTSSVGAPDNQSAPTPATPIVPAYPATQPTATPQTPVAPTGVPTTPTSSDASRIVRQAYANVTKPASIKAIGTSLGFGMGAALVFALVEVLITTVIGQNFFTINDALHVGLAPIVKNVDDGNFIQKLVAMLLMGVSGGQHSHTSTSGLMDSRTFDGSTWWPINLSGVALLVGAAFGAYHIAHAVGTRIKWDGAIGAGVVGVATGLCYLILGMIFPMHTSVSTSLIKTEGSTTAVTFRTFVMAFLLAAFGALVGYAMAQYASDSRDVFHALGRFAHRLRGPARTFIEAFAAYTLVSTALALLAFLAFAINAQKAGVLGLMLFLMPFLQFVIVAASTFGGLTFQDESHGSESATFFQIMSEVSERNGTSYTWVLVLLTIAFILTSLYVALRAAARNSQDPFYAKWKHTWKAPAATAVFWFFALFALASIGSQSSGSDNSYMFVVSIVSWYPLVAAVWAFAIEAVAMTVGPTILASVPGLWRFVKGGLVEPTPQSIKDYVTACKADFKHLSDINGKLQQSTVNPAPSAFGPFTAQPDVPRKPTAPTMPTTPTMPRNPNNANHVVPMPMPAPTSQPRVAQQAPDTPASPIIGTQPFIPGPPPSNDLSDQTQSSPEQQ